MKVDLAGRSALVVGRDGLVARAILSALAGNGAAAALGDADACAVGEAPDILVAVHDLLADDPAVEAGALIEATERIAAAMAARGGRVIVVTTSFGLLPARRHAAQSVATAATVAAMRSLAMRLGPKVLVNAVGAGAIGDGEGGFLAGGEALLSHVPLGEAGTIDDLVHAVLFIADPMNTYLTGQVIAVDGGWGAGYGRNF